MIGGRSVVRAIRYDRRLLLPQPSGSGSGVLACVCVCVCVCVCGVWWMFGG